MAQSTCRTCDAPLVWQDTENGRRPFNPDGTPHRDARSNGRPASSPDKERSIRRQVAMKCAAELVAAAVTSHEDARISLVFAVADQIDKWLEKGGDATD
ncbi:MAG: hypothetical protein V4529_17365 [Gemmatimonadota bacterium]